MVVEWVLGTMLAYAGYGMKGGNGYGLRGGMKGWKGIGVLAGWRVVEMGVGWVTGFGCEFSSSLGVFDV